MLILNSLLYQLFKSFLLLKIKTLFLSTLFKYLKISFLFFLFHFKVNFINSKSNFSLQPGISNFSFPLPLINLEIISPQELKLQIDRHQGNEEMSTILKNFLEDNSNQEYNLRVEYDDDGLVNALILTMVEKN